MARKPELIVALDAPDRDTALDMARAVCGRGGGATYADRPWLKVGLELFTSAGPGVVGDLAGLGAQVFLDLKFFDIPNTVAGAVRSATRLGVSMLNIHCMGGERMAHAALQGREQGLSTGQEPPLLIGVTVLTSMAAADLAAVRGADTDPGELALTLARHGAGWGLDGVVCSPLEVAAVKQACGPAFACVTPGVRPAGADTGDQRRVATPGDAVRAGADFLVVGRPVTGSADPAASASAIREEMALALQ